MKKASTVSSTDLSINRQNKFAEMPFAKQPHLQELREMIVLCAEQDSAVMFKTLISNMLKHGFNRTEIISELSVLVDHGVIQYYRSNKDNPSLHIRLKEAR
jgi:hypothetical protein